MDNEEGEGEPTPPQVPDWQSLDPFDTAEWDRLLAEYLVNVERFGVKLTRWRARQENQGPGESSPLRDSNLPEPDLQTLHFRGLQPESSNGGGVPFTSHHNPSRSPFVPFRPTNPFFLGSLGSPLAPGFGSQRIGDPIGGPEAHGQQLLHSSQPQEQRTKSPDFGSQAGSFPSSAFGNPFSLPPIPTPSPNRMSPPDTAGAGDGGSLSRSAPPSGNPFTGPKLCNSAQKGDFSVTSNLPEGILQVHSSVSGNRISLMIAVPGAKAEDGLRMEADRDRNLLLLLAGPGAGSPLAEIRAPDGIPVDRLKVMKKGPSAFLIQGVFGESEDENGNMGD